MNADFTDNESFFSAKGMNSAGDTKPSSGRCDLISASAPKTSSVSDITCG